MKKLNEINPMQSSGSSRQLVLHLKRCQLIHPIGGVRAKPLSKAWHELKMNNSITNKFNVCIFVEMWLSF